MHINELQELMRRLYFPRDLQRGPEKTFEWLVEEIAELGGSASRSR
jgi:NTP pyrophosphatase (non-canonical NTP hydrolase)